ncbi:MAG: rhamnogalacturonan acetylesterase, partial [Sedimentisphaerales bacterium]|nr:rhamnogalacturonan acetylesterase [Sedimentisphaerales bacterium]
ESGVWHWDDELTLEFNGKRTCLCALEIEYEPDIPTIFLAGDSTVTDQPAEPWTSWGQMLTLLFKPEIAIANYAESGETLAAFTAEKRFAKIFSQIKKGDYLFIQFAHNDMKRGTPEQTGYAEALRHLVSKTRDLGACPVLVTSMHRRSFDDNGKVKDTMQGYPEAMEAVASMENVALLDLHAMSSELYEALGPSGSAIAFQDGTHHNAYGAYEIARCVALAISREMPELKPYLTDGADAFRPAVPDDIAGLDFPVSLRSSIEKPEGD